jgi:hypothetical protein
MTTINFTRAKLAQLKDHYTMAKRRGADQFEFEGHPIIMAYAKYLIEYLESQFKPDVREVEEPLNHRVNRRDNGK